MKWATLLKEIKEKVGLSQPPSTSSSASTSPSFPGKAGQPRPHFSYFSSRDKHELELDFKRCWEEFRSSVLEKEKETALNMTVDAFCKLAKQHTNVAQLVTMLVETHIFSFVVGRAFVTDIEKLKISNKTRSLDAVELLRFFSEVTEDGINPGSNLLTAVEVLVSGPIDKQSLLDSGILCCLIYILNSLLGESEANVTHNHSNYEGLSMADHHQDSDVALARRLEMRQ